MRQPKILIKKKFKFNDVFVEEKPSTRKIDPLLDQKAAKIWAKRLEQAKKNGQKAWESITYRLNGFCLKNDQLFLDFGLIPFSIRNTLKRMPELDKLSDDYLPKGLAIGGFVKTADDYLIMGKRSGRTLGVGKIDFIGGVLSKDEIVVNTGQDLQRCLLQELEEEVNLTFSDLSENPLILGLLESETGNILIVTFLKLRLNKQQVLEKFNQQNDQEFKSLVFTPKNKSVDFLGSLTNLRPVSAGFLDLIF